SLSLPDFRRSVSPNSSFKPTPLRYTKHMAGTACHVLCSTTRRGLTQVLGRKEQAQSDVLAPGRLAHGVAQHPCASVSRSPREIDPPPVARLRVLDRRPGSALADIAGQALASA